MLFRRAQVRLVIDRVAWPRTRANRSSGNGIRGGTIDRNLLTNARLVTKTPETSR
jgi:hypothetical protein